MTYEELKIKLDLYDPEDVLRSIGRKWNYFVGRQWNYCRFVVCDEGDCHLFREDGTEDDIRKVDKITSNMIPRNIKKIIIPDSVTIIGDSAFNYCINLARVTIPDSVISIEDIAFAGCKGLTSISIPMSVTSIGIATFDGCSRLKSLIFKGKTMDEVKAMKYYPFEIEDVSIIRCI